MLYLGYALFLFAIVAADQFTKYITVTNIDLYGKADFIPGILGFTYVQNTGAAFSSFSGMQWLFVLVFALFTVLLVWQFWKKPMPFRPFENWCLVAIYAGGLGNMIDRLSLGYVVDMIEVLFFDFAVFNVADCFITCGTFALIISLLFFNKDFWRDEKK